MKLAHFLLDTPLEFYENTVNVLILENPRFFRTVVSELTDQAEGGSGRFALSDGQDDLEIWRSAEVLTDFYRLDFSAKRFSTKIQQEAISCAKSFSDQCMEIYRQINELAALISASVRFDVGYNAPETVDGIVKLLNFSFEDSGTSFAERLLNYAKVCRELFGKKLFIFVNLKSAMSNEELSLFYRDCLYEKINLLLIESVQRPALLQEKMRLIDSDLCEI